MAFSQEVYDKNALSLAFGSINYPNLKSIVCELDSNNSLSIQFSENLEGIATLNLNGKVLHQNDKLTSKNDVHEAIERYLNGKFGYKVFYSFSSETKVHKHDNVHFERTTSVSDIDFDRPIFKKHVEEAIRKSNQQSDISDRPQKRPERPKPQPRKKSNRGAIWGVVVVILILFRIVMVLQRNNQSSYEEDSRNRALQDMIEQREEFNKRKKLIEEQRRAYSESYEIDEDIEENLEEIDIYHSNNAQVEILSMRDDGAQHGFILIKVKDLTSGRIYHVYNAQSLPSSVKVGSKVQTEYVNLNSGLDLQYPVVYIDI